MGNKLYNSNRELSEALGCHLTAASRLRSGKRQPSLGMAVRVVEAFALTGAKAYEGISAMATGGEVQATWFDRYVAAYVQPTSKPKAAKKAPAKKAPAKKAPATAAA